MLHTELNWDPRTNEDERSPENFWAAMENGLVFYVYPAACETRELRRLINPR